MSSNGYTDKTEDIDLEELYIRKTRERHRHSLNQKPQGGGKNNEPDTNDEKIAVRRRNRMIANIMIYSGIAILVILCIIVGALLFIGQNGKSITSIRFTEKSVELRAGRSQKLSVVTEPAGNEYALSFSSSDSDVLTVAADGTINAVKAGDAVVTVKSGSLEAKCDVRVVRDTINTMEISTSELRLGGGEEAEIALTLTPSEAADKDIVWVSNDSSIADVDQSGRIKGVSAGETVVLVKDTVTGLTKEINVTVTSLELPDAMEFEKQNVTLEVGDKYTAVLKFTPDNISHTSAIYYTTDKEIASVTNEGVITAKQAGTCEISAYYENDYTMYAVMEVTVIDPFVITSAQGNNETPAPEQPVSVPTPEGNHKIEVIDGISYVDGILIANKTYALPSSYDPGTDSEAYAALGEMEEAAAADGIVLYLQSGYRSYDTQAAIYNNYVSMDGKAEADRYSARPGHSEHQTGLAFDLNDLNESFGDTPEGKWLAANCYRYGFIIRYPKGKEHITGYMYEPWHVRYLGREVAEKVYNSGLTLEEYLGITSRYAD